MTTRKLRRRLIDEPTQSDATLLLKVEDLIHLAMGPNDQNMVNFKLLQTILYILARQMRLLDQKVELKTSEKREYSESITEEESSEGPSRVRKKEVDKGKGKGKDAVAEEGKKGRGKSADESDEEIRRRRERGEYSDEETGKGRGKGDDREGAEGKGKGRERDEGPEGRGRGGRGYDDESDEDRGGRRKGGRGRDDESDEERGGRRKGGRGRDDEGSEGRGRGKGGRGRDDESPEGSRRGGRGRDDEGPEGRGRGKGGRGRDESPEGSRKGGRGRDDEGPGGKGKGGRGGGRDDEGPEGRGKGGRGGGRDDEGPGGKGKGGRGGGRDEEDAEGRGKGGRGGGRDDEGPEGRGKGGRGGGRDDESPEGRGKGGRGRGKDDQGPEGRGKGGRGGRDDESPEGKGKGRGAEGRGKGGEGAGGRGKGGRGGDESDEERGGRKGRSGDRGRDEVRDDSRGRGGKGGEGRGEGREGGAEGRGRGKGGGRDEDAEGRGRGAGAGGKGKGGEGAGKGGKGAGRGGEGEDDERGGRGGRGARGGRGEDESDEEDERGGGRDGRGAGAKGRGRGADDEGGWEDEKGRKGGPGGAGAGARGGRPGAGAGAGRAGAAPSGSSIAVSEKLRDKDKILAVGKGPKGAAGPMRVGSVEVVTQKEFAILANAVKALQEKAGPLPTPTLPDNKKLRDDIVKGSASLMDTMQAMRLAARVQAAEKAIDTMADLLTHLASTGVLPPEVARAAEKLHDEVVAVRREIESASGKGGDSDKKRVKGFESKMGTAGSPSAVSTVSAGSRFGRGGAGGRLSIDSRAGVAHGELDEALRQMKEDIMQNMSAVMNRAASAADAAALHVKSISDKMEVATKLDHRVSQLHSLVNDYAEQLTGFDNGLTTQMAGFHEQMTQMRTDMTCGLQQLEQVNNNAETAAVLELTERYEGLVSELDSTLHAHQGLTTYQRELSDELRSLVEAVEMMREQKADRDEVQDGLRDKADSSRLAGLLTDEQFQHARESLEIRMEMCYDKFRKQDLVWMDVVRDFARVSETKAELMQLLSIREEAQQELRELNCKVKQLAKMLGDPKAAIITRKLAKDAACAVCRVPALMEPREPVQPFALPMARPPPTGAAAYAEEEEPCLKEMLIAEADDEEQPPHYCRRWVGGSHTLIGHAPGLGNVSRKKARGFPFSHPSKKYLGYGKDGKLYKFEELEPEVPCAECNAEPKPPTPEVAEEKIPGEADMASEGAGEGAARMSRRVTLVDASTARRVTVIDETELVEALEAEVALASPGGSRRPTVTEPGSRRPTLSEVPRNSLEEESLRAATGTTSTTGTDVTEVAVRDITEAANRPSVVIDLPGSRRATVVGDVDTFPSLGARVSTMTRASAIAVAQMSRRGTEVGTTIQGHVTTMGEDEAEREAILKQIAEDKAASEARAEGAAGGGTPVDVENKEEQKEEAQ